ncbi:MAG: hypothetical protein IJU80_05490 [Lachnospiraceae bacterium]|nr:hypothetical protein [Lachnospiraceae bacterium]
MQLIRYRFKTKAVDDYRPLIDMVETIKMPWWCTGFGYKNLADEEEYATIVCYLPEGEDLLKYWDDAYDIDSSKVNYISYSDRFPEPEALRKERE